MLCKWTIFLHYCCLIILAVAKQGCAFGPTFSTAVVRRFTTATCTSFRNDVRSRANYLALKMSHTSPAHKFNLYGWQPNRDISDDENYMDIVFLITRSSSQDGQQGHMGALVVRPSSGAKTEGKEESDEDHRTRIFQGILGAATNTPLFGGKDRTSDIHAEISALGEACRSSQSTEGCTAYITIPPCKRCFAALVAFGIRRIVSGTISPALIRETASNHGIEVFSLDRDTNRRQMERVNRLVNKDRTDEELVEIAEKNRLIRQQRKLVKQTANSFPPRGTRS